MHIQFQTEILQFIQKDYLSYAPKKVYNRMDCLICDEMQLKRTIRFLSISIGAMKNIVNTNTCENVCEFNISVE